MRFSTSAFPDNGPKKHAPLIQTLNLFLILFQNLRIQYTYKTLKVIPPSIRPPLFSLYPSFYSSLPLSLSSFHYILLSMSPSIPPKNFFFKLGCEIEVREGVD
jgi:hypothetical protein